jgi:putative methylase
MVDHAMRKKDIEILIEMIPKFSSPDEKLEQYVTPSHIASDMVWTAFMLGDIENRIVVDLGCGTGKLSLAAMLLGASYTICVDIDYGALKTASASLRKLSEKGLVEFLNSDVSASPFRESFHGVTVIQNPPFGVIQKGADLMFLNKAFEIGDSIYSLHKYVPQSIDLIKRIALTKGFKAFLMRKYRFPIFWFLKKHRSRVRYIDVVLIRFNKIYE